MRRALSELAQVNPQVNVPAGAGALTPVSFVPMADVTESGHWIGRQVRALREVSNGFTAFSDGDVLVAKITPCFENGKGAQVVGLTNGIGFGSTEFHVLRARDGVSPRFVYHVAQSTRLRKAAEVYMSGSAGQKRVPREFFDAFGVPDLPIQEQQKVSAVLDTLDATIRQTEAIIEKLKQVKQGLLHDLLTRGIDANGELRPPQSQAPHLYKDSPLGWTPREWDVGPLSSWLAGRPKNGYSPQPAGRWTGIQMLGLGCLTAHGFEPRQLKDAPLGDALVPKAFLVAGDLLMSRANTREFVGLVGSYRDVGTPCCYPDLLRLA